MLNLEAIQAVITTEQINRLYITSQANKMLTIQVLPEGEKALTTSPEEPCVNTNAVIVFQWWLDRGEFSVHNYWTFEGKWQQDFFHLVNSRLEELETSKQERLKLERAEARARLEKQIALLETYK